MHKREMHASISPPTKGRFLFRTIVPSCLILLVLACTLPTFGQARFDKAQQVDQAVLAEMESQQLVGVAIGIIQGNRVVYAQGYGLANLNDRDPVTTESIFNWASNSKPVMAVAALQLVQDGQLELDQAIGGYLPGLPDHLKPLTTRQLLCHQSGIPHYRNGKIVPGEGQYSIEQELDPLHAINRFKLSPLIFTPGERMEYSSHAYVLLSAVVQAAGQRSLQQQLQERLCKPLQMTSFQLDLPYRGQPNWVRAYFLRNEEQREVQDNAHCWKHGAGGYKSNIKDFARFAVALSARELLSDATTQSMWTTQSTTSGKPTRYGLGVAVSGDGDNLKISHGGSQDETKTRMVLYPNQKHGIVVMSNSQQCRPASISTAIYDALND